MKTVDIKLVVEIDDSCAFCLISAKSTKNVENDDVADDVSTKMKKTSESGERSIKTISVIIPIKHSDRLEFNVLYDRLSNSSTFYWRLFSYESALASFF